MVSGKMKDLSVKIRQKITNLDGGKEMWKISFNFFHERRKFQSIMEEFQILILTKLYSLYKYPQRKFFPDKFKLSYRYYL